MMDAALRNTQLAVERPDLPATSVIRVAGELTGAVGPRLRRVLDKILRGGRVERVVIDLANVRWFEVAGVAVLHDVQYRLDKVGVRLVLVGIDAHRPAFPRRIDNAFEGFETVADLEEALMPTVPA